VIVAVFSTVAFAAGRIYRYDDDQGNPHFTADPGTVPKQYLPTLKRLDDLEADKKEAGVMDQLRKAATSTLSAGKNQDGDKHGGSKKSSKRGSVGTLNGQRSHTAGGRQSTVAHPTVDDLLKNIDLNALKKRLAHYPDSRLHRKMIVAMVAALQSGFFWVVILAILLGGVALFFAVLARAETRRKARIFWRVKFPLFCAIAIGILAKSFYSDYAAIYHSLINLLQLQ